MRPRQDHALVMRSWACRSAQARRNATEEGRLRFEDAREMELAATAAFARSERWIRIGDRSACRARRDVAPLDGAAEHGRRVADLPIDESARARRSPALVMVVARRVCSRRSPPANRGIVENGMWKSSRPQANTTEPKPDRPRPRTIESPERQPPASGSLGVHDERRDQEHRSGCR